VTIALLEAAAAELGHLCEQVVFLGGATVGLWFSDPAARAPRVTYDVDVVSEVSTLAGYARFQEELRERGFVEDIESRVTARYRHRESSVILDVVPVEVRPAGLGGRWLKPSVRAAVQTPMPSGIELRVVPPAWLVVTALDPPRGGSMPAIAPVTRLESAGAGAPRGAPRCRLPSPRAPTW